MEKIEIATKEVQDLGTEYSYPEKQIGDIQIVMSVSIDDDSYQLIYQTIVGLNYETLPAVDLNDWSGDDTGKLGKRFDCRSEDGYKV